MYRQILLLTFILFVQQAVAQEVRLSADVLRLVKVKSDTIPGKFKPSTEQAAEALKLAKQTTVLLIKEGQKQQLLADNMICVYPDMEEFSRFPAVDPTKKSTYIPDNMPNPKMVDKRIPVTPPVK